MINNRWYPIIYPIITTGDEWMEMVYQSPAPLLILTKGTLLVESGVGMDSSSGWWFGTCMFCFLHILGLVIPIDELICFKRLSSTTTQFWTMKCCIWANCSLTTKSPQWSCSMMGSWLPVQKVIDKWWVFCVINSSSTGTLPVLKPRTSDSTIQSSLGGDEHSLTIFLVQSPMFLPWFSAWNAHV